MIIDQSIFNTHFYFQSVKYSVSTAAVRKYSRTTGKENLHSKKIKTTYIGRNSKAMEGTKSHIVADS